MGREVRPIMTCTRVRRVTVRRCVLVLAGIWHRSLAGPGTLKHVGRFDGYADKNERMKSFYRRGWTNEEDIEFLASLGFFLSEDGKLGICFSCGLNLQSLKLGDDTVPTHIYFAPGCEFLNGILQRETRDYFYEFQEPDVIGLADERLRSNCGIVNLQYTKGIQRIDSFQYWPIEHPSKEQVSEAGFYYAGHRDLVQCFHCNGLIHGWRAGDDPWTKHALRFPYCQYVIQKKGLEFIRRVNGKGIHQERQIEESKENNGASTNSGAQNQFRHPEYESYQERISSFGHWQSESRQTPEQLAEAGFFFTGDEVRCYACDGGLRSWDACDQPWLEHARWFPNCRHVLAVKGADYVQLVQQAVEHQGGKQQQYLNTLEGQNYTNPQTMAAVNGTQTSGNSSDCVGDTETNTDVDDSGESGEAGLVNM